MPDETSISADYLRQRLRYEPETGKLYWLRFAKQRANWNSMWAGKEAFTAVRNTGYFHGRLDNVAHQAHRVAWALHHGVWPTGTIDHINGDPRDNRIENLRDVSHQENHRNQRVRKNNTSGAMGVSWFRGTGRWSAYIMVDKRKQHLGYFAELADATAARKAAEKLFGFHANHGKARTARSKDA